MANHQSARKKIRQIARRRQINKRSLNRISSLEKRLVQFVQKKDKKQALEQLQILQAQMDRSVQKGLQHHNKVSRKKSQLTILVNNI